MRLRKVRELVKAYAIVLGTLVLIDVVFGGAVSEIDAGAVFEFSRMRGEVEGKKQGV